MEEMPIAFFSKKLTLAQMKWSTIEREAFSMLEALRKFDTWIFGSQIQVISDHDPLTYLTNSAPHSAKLTRWALALQRYNAKVSYRRGSAHGNAMHFPDLEFLSASSSDGCFSIGGRSKNPLTHSDRPLNNPFRNLKKDFVSCANELREDQNSVSFWLSVVPVVMSRAVL
ncbi:retrovirus-related Pol polyprotein from transposon 297 [Trichonephila clavata]|nr:retrovirus-related Pol polyprotein from transposon 297 [Trichonephila clavata]